MIRAILEALIASKEAALKSMDMWPDLFWADVMQGILKAEIESLKESLHKYPEE